jgi:hypothetical protein
MAMLEHETAADALSILHNLAAWSSTQKFCELWVISAKRLAKLEH